MKDDSIEVSSKNLPLRIALFILALIVAAGAFTFGVKKLTGNEAGYAVVSARADGDAPLYASGTQLNYRFEGKSSEIRLLKNEISDAYSAALAYIWKLLDAKTVYPGYEGNLAYLNGHPNEDVTVPRALFDILADALERSEREEGFSLYSAPLLAAWETIVYTENPVDFDPLRNDGEAERLRAIARACADRSNCSLELVDAENCVVRLNVSESYRAFLEDYELPRTVLDLNRLKDAYILREVAAALELRGYRNGYLASRTGLTLSLSGDMEGAYEIYSYVNQETVIAASVPAAPDTACSLQRAFPLGEEAGYYELDGILRGPYLLPDEDWTEAPLRSVMVLRRDGDVLEACMESLRLATEQAGKIADAAASSDASLVVWTLLGEDGHTIHAAGDEAAQVQPQEGFQIVIEEAAPTSAQTAAPQIIPEPTPAPTPVPTPEPTPEPKPLRQSWTLSFAGDCTIGTLHAWQNSASPINMLYVMQGDWTYPFSNVAGIFADDDFTMVNLEGAFTEANIPKSKAYCFRAPPEAAQTLVCGGIEAVTLANNHSRDYGTQGLEDTRAALDAQGIRWTDDGVPLIVELPDDGPRLGILSFNCVETELVPGDLDAYLRRLSPEIAALRAENCDLLIAFLHWGWEYRTAPEPWMEELAHRLAEAGCDMVIGSHPHVLQRFERWERTPICYSLGNFCFGGHSSPADMDSAIVSQRVERTADGFALGETDFLPCAISSVTERNDFRPTPYAPDSPEARRVLEKLGFSQDDGI